ncbi:hypothetical protein FOA43_000281 [Brettanomyces nanus]|uniref:Uncharacterized protein n=1 Tax=Eeniella nana TaxID=13502 RepID=A0A875RSY2_EENNA|nr:uncharacterized protein FOA43_000281 [Brettanomyces nanus]QPG72977.1 hypothetical protein FOA43_000281 [Brettanomyces nanus]
MSKACDKFEKVALINNANSPIGKEITKLLAKRSVKVYAVDRDSLFYIDELLKNNPEMESNISPILLSKNKTVTDLSDLLTREGTANVHIVVDLNLSENELVTDDFKFVSNLIDSSLVGESCVFCFGNVNAINSPSVLKAANEFIDVVQNEVEAKLGEQHSAVINLFDPRALSRYNPEDIASFYINSLIRCSYRVSRIGNLKDVLYTAMYYGLPLNAYKYMEETGQMLEDWTSPNLNDVGEPELL